jgi:mRNA interferase ChpB
MILRVDRGDIVHVDLEPTKGKEIRGFRPALVLTPKAFNVFGLALVAPITQGALASRENGFTVPLMGSGSQTQGVVNENSLRLNRRALPEPCAIRVTACIHGVTVNRLYSLNSPP